jgi:hypothetical protein
MVVFLCHDEQQTTQGRKDRQKGTTTKDMRTTAITTTSKPRRGASADFKARQPRIYASLHQAGLSTNTDRLRERLRLTFCWHPRMGRSQPHLEMVGEG